MKIFCLALAVMLVSAAPDNLKFSSHDIQYSGQLTGYHIEDLNFDGLKDILLFTLQQDKKTKNSQRIASLHFHKKHGFNSEPDQIFPLSRQQLIYDIGNIAGDAKKEFIYLTDKEARYFVFTDSGFAPESLPIFKTQSLFLLPTNQNKLSFDFVGDINNDGRDEIMLPAIHHFDIYHQSKTGWQLNRIPLYAEASYAGFYHPRYSVGRRAEAHYAAPYIIFDDFNADQKTDIIGVYSDSLVVFTQADSGKFSPKRFLQIPANFGQIWPGHKIQKTQWGEESIKNFFMRLTDIDGDGLLDVTQIQKSTEKSIMSPHSEIRIFLGKLKRPGDFTTFYLPSQPDQTISPGGALIVFDLEDLNKDGRKDLLLPVVGVGIGNIVRMLLTKTVKIQAETYFMSKAHKYPQQPTRKNEIVVNFTFRGGTTSPVYEIADFNGDGLKDVATGPNTSTLAFVFGDLRRGFKKAIGHKLHVRLPQNGELVNAMQMNNDNKADILINYNESNPANPKLKKTIRILLSK